MDVRGTLRMYNAMHWLRLNTFDLAADSVKLCEVFSKCGSLWRKTERG